MAFLNVKNVKISGVSACVPKNVVENKNYDVIPVEQRDRFISTIGIERRHVVEPGVCASDLCCTAADSLLRKIGWDRSEIDLLIFVSQAPDYKMPATACVLQHRLNLPKSCMAFDVSLGCSGYVYGLGVAGSMLSTGSMMKALLLVGSSASLYTNYYDQSAYPLFGDAGSATALEFSPREYDRIDLYYATDGSGEHSLIIPDGGYRNPVSLRSFELEEFPGGIRRNRLNLRMEGDDVFSFVISQVPKAIRALFEYNQIEPDELDYYLLHQASLFTCESLRKRMKFPIDKVPYILKDYGNSSNASIPLILATKLKEEVTKRKLNILISGFGIGLSLACGVISIGKLDCAEYVTI